MFTIVLRRVYMLKLVRTVLQVAGICLIHIIDRILARLPAYFAPHFNVQFNDRSPADQSG
jgi:hypothetical protein